jgi:hypothetical protein
LLLKKLIGSTAADNELKAHDTLLLKGATLFALALLKPMRLACP